MWYKTIGTTTLIVAMSLFSGCGGGGSGAPSKLAINTNAKSIAYKAKNGDWKSIDVSSGTPTADGLKEYMVNKDDRFMVALKCTDKRSYLFAFSKDDGDVKFRCSKLTIGFGKTLSGTLGDTVTAPPLTGFITAIGTKWALNTTAPFDYTYTLKRGLYDFIAVSLNSASNPARFLMKRNINLNQNKTLNISMDTANSCAIKSKSFNAGSGFRIVYISKGNTYFTSNTGGKWYYPDCTQDSNDIYVLVGKDNTGKKVSLETAPVNAMTKADIGAQETAHINALTQLSYQDSGQISGLGQYVSNPKSPKLQVFTLDIQNATSKHYSLILSKKYLDSGDVFDMPKLSAISGFSGAWDGDNATKVNAEAMMSDIKLGKILKGRMLRLSEINTFATRNCKMEFAKQEVK